MIDRPLTVAEFLRLQRQQQCGCPTDAAAPGMDPNKVMELLTAILPHLLAGPGEAGNPIVPR